MFRYRILGLAFSLLIALLIGGCENRQAAPVAPQNPAKGGTAHLATDPPPPSPPPSLPAAAGKSPVSAPLSEKSPLKRPFHDPIEPAVSELTTGALATWRSFSAVRPTLVLFSTHPLLVPLDADLRDAVRSLVLNGSAGEIVERGRFFVPNPLLLPHQTVSAAIDTGLIGELVLVLPRSDSPDRVSLPDFQQKAVNAGFLTVEEARGLTLKDGTLSGTVRGIPLRVVHPAALPSLPGPVILHVDLGYFKDLFVNDIKTPLYDLLHQAMEAIRAAGWPTAAVTLSYSNQEVGFSLDTRFMISNFATVLRQPELLQGGTPASWELRAKAALASALYSESTYQDLLVEAAAATPDDPAAHYALAIALFQSQLNAEGFASLARAVQLDKGYALAYLDLADQGENLGQIDKAVELLSRAATLMPENPFIRMRLVTLLPSLGRNYEAKGLLRELNKLPWDPTFHPEIPPLLEKMTETVFGTGESKIDRSSLRRIIGARSTTR